MIKGNLIARFEPSVSVPGGGTNSSGARVACLQIVEKAEKNRPRNYYLSDMTGIAEYILHGNPDTFMDVEMLDIYVVLAHSTGKIRLLEVRD